MNNRNYVQIDYIGITIEEMGLRFENAEAALNYATEFEIDTFQLYFYDSDNKLIAVLECNNHLQK